MPRYQNLETHEVDTKTGPNDLVTIADREMELALCDILPDILPGSVVIGEEGVSEGKVSTELLKDHSSSYWVVDPVDGTYNFRHGKRHFGVMAALVQNGETLMGWLYDVLGQSMMICEAGSGAHIEDQKIYLETKHKAHGDLSGFAYFSTRKHIEPWKQKVKSIDTLRCSAHEYLYLLRQEHDFGVYSRCRPWDHLVGTLAYQEAGGIVKTWDGVAYKPEMDKAALIVATHEDLWQDIHNSLTK